MSKIAVVIFSDTITTEALGKVSNAFILASEAIEQGDDPKLIFEGAGTKWIGELENNEHKLHNVYVNLKSKITGICQFCAQAFGVKNEIELAEVPLLAEYHSHPSLRTLVRDNYEIITF